MMSFGPSESLPLPLAQLRKVMTPWLSTVCGLCPILQWVNLHDPPPLAGAPECHRRHLHCSPAWPRWAGGWTPAIPRHCCGGARLPIVSHSSIYFISCLFSNFRFHYIVSVRFRNRLPEIINLFAESEGFFVEKCTRCKSYKIKIN